MKQQGSGCSIIFILILLAFFGVISWSAVWKLMLLGVIVNLSFIIIWWMLAYFNRNK